MNMTFTIHKEITESLQYIEELMRKGGPSESDLPKLKMWFRQTAEKVQTKVYSPVEIDAIKQAFKPIIRRDTVWGMCYLKPYGYAGDFEIIDMVYQEYINPDPILKKWDRLVQESNGLKAVRNRKELFKQLTKQYSQPLDYQVLNVASGPCRDVMEYLQANPNQSITIDCLEHDKHAITYATKLLQSVNPAQYQFIHANIFKFDTSKRYDFIWSAGLFDYFDDTTFIKILQQLFAYLKPKGRIVIGNFCWKSESRFMKELVDWHLHYRTRKELLALGEAACSQYQSMDILEEEEGVNLFLEIAKEG